MSIAPVLPSARLPFSPGHIYTPQELHLTGATVHDKGSDRTKVFTPRTSEECYTPVGLTQGLFSGPEGIQALQEARKVQEIVDVNMIGQLVGIPELAFRLPKLNEKGMTEGDPVLGRHMYDESINAWIFVEISNEAWVYENLEKRLQESMGEDFSLYWSPERCMEHMGSSEGTRRMMRK